MDTTSLSALQKYQSTFLLIGTRRMECVAKQQWDRPEFSHLHKMSLTPDEQARFQQTAELPVVFTETYRRSTGESSYFADPPRSGTASSLNIYLQRWGVFAALLMQANYGQGRNCLPAGNAMGLLVRALSAAEEAGHYTKYEIQDLIDRLWQHRWIFSVSHCVWLRHVMLGWTDEEFRAALSRTSMLDYLSQQLDERLKSAREQSSDLDAWFEALYNLEPLSQFVLHLMRTDVGPEANKLSRYVDEICADIFEVTTIAEVSLNSRNPDAFAETYLREPRHLLKLGGLKWKRALQYGYQSRTHYPKSWCDAAAAYLERGAEGPLPQCLVDVNSSYMASRLVTARPEAYLRRTEKL